MVSRKEKNNIERDNRLNTIMAIIFLLVGAIIFKLYNLQVIKYDLYVALASDQHQIYNELEPERGKIYIQDSQELFGDKYYPLATNKEFSLIYAVPDHIEDAQKTSEALYEVFDQKIIDEGVEKMLDEDEYFSLDSEANKDISAQEWEKRKEFREVKKQAEIELKKKEIIDGYLEKLNKKHDPYEPIKQKVDQEDTQKIKEMNLPGINQIMVNYRYYPEENVGSHILGFVGYNDDKKCGQYGLEGFFNEELTGKFGLIKAERSAQGEVIIINDREYTKPINGSDLVLTINRSIQFAACRDLDEAAQKYGAKAGTIIVMEPKSGAILAMCSWPNFDPNNYNKVENINIYNNPAIFDQYEPGSIFKPLTIAAAIDQEKITPETTYEDKGFVMIEGWDKPIKNSDYETSGGHGVVSMVSVLENSLNTGAIFAMQQIGESNFADYVMKFGFGEKTGIEMETEGSGDITNLKRKNIRPVEAATATFGQGITATPLQMVTAFAAIANGGILMKPFLVSEIISPSGEITKTQPKQIRRVISERTALLVSGMMVNVVDGGHAVHAAVNGYYVAGKTGTAQVADKEKGGYYESETIHSFVGFAPAEDPMFVALVKLDDPKAAPFAASTAAPLFGKLADFILNYYQVPKEL